MATIAETARAVLTWTRDALRAYWGPPIWASNAPNGLGYGGPTASGIAVSEYGALNLTAIWCGVLVISGGIASLPLILYKRVGDDRRERFYEHPLYRLLHDEPNPDMSAPTFWQTLIQHMLLWGNGYAEIRRDGFSGRVRRLDLITPDRVQIKRAASGEVYYAISNPTRPASRIDAVDMFHVPGLGYDGVCGYSVVQMLRESLGLSLAADRFGSTFFGNAAQPGGVLELGTPMNKSTREQLKAELAEFRGAGSHGTLILENGMAWKQTAIPPDDAQFIQTRKFQVEEVARILNVPLHKIHSMEQATNNNIEQQAMEFLSDTLLPHMTKITAECDRKLIAPSERRIQYTEHLIDERLRVDVESRYAAYRVGRDMGVLTARKICALENIDPPPDAIADLYLVPANMVNAAFLLTPPAPSPAPAPAAPPVEPERAEALAILADVAQLREEIAQFPTTPALDVQALGAEVADRLRDDLAALIPPPGEPLDLDATLAKAASMIAAAMPPTPDPPPAPDVETVRQLHEWQHATLELLVGRMVRKEQAAAKKWAASTDDERLAERMDAFYARFVEEGMDALRPWLLRLQNGSGPRDDAVRKVLISWAARGKRAVLASEDRGGMILRWEANHERILAAEIGDVIYAHAE